MLWTGRIPSRSYGLHCLGYSRNSGIVIVVKLDITGPGTKSEIYQYPALYSRVDWFKHAADTAGCHGFVVVT